MSAPAPPEPAETGSGHGRACTAYALGVLGIPDGSRACLFDLDGVLTRTAVVHAAVWKSMFDAFLADRARRTGAPFVPFDPGHDDAEYVDGRPRIDGVVAERRGLRGKPAPDLDQLLSRG